MKGLGGNTVSITNRRPYQHNKMSAGAAGSEPRGERLLWGRAWQTASGPSCTLYLQGRSRP